MNAHDLQHKLRTAVGKGGSGGIDARDGSATHMGYSDAAVAGGWGRGSREESAMAKGDDAQQLRGEQRDACVDAGSYLHHEVT